MCGHIWTWLFWNQGTWDSASGSNMQNLKTSLKTENPCRNKKLLSSPQPSRPGLGPTQPPVQCVPGSFLGSCGRGVMLTTHLYLTPTLRMGGTILFSPCMPSLELRVQIPPRAWISVCCDCCVLSRRGLCDGPITRPEESYRLWYIIVCVLETWSMRRSWPTVCQKKINNKCLHDVDTDNFTLLPEERKVFRESFNSLRPLLKELNPQR